MMLQILEALYYPFKLIYKIYCFLFFAISLILFYPIFKVLLSKKSRFPKAFKVMRFYAWCFHFFLFLPIKIKSSPKKMPSGPFLICPNHSSFFDIPAVYRIFSNYFTFVGKREIEKWPLFRIFYTSGMNILVDRDNSSNSILSVRQMLAEIEEGHPLVIFPEGTITKNAPRMGPFRKGAFLIAIQKQIPIVPVTFLTNYKRLERKMFFKGYASPGVCEVVIHSPISTVGLTRADLPELEKRIKLIIEQPMNENAQKLKFSNNLYYPICASEKLKV